MRQFSNPSKPPNHPQFLLNQRAVYNPNKSASSLNEVSNPRSQRSIQSIQSEQLDVNIENELKRIESYLNTDTKTYFENLGLNLSYSDQAKNPVEFHTASFKSKEDIKQAPVLRVPQNNNRPSLFEMNNENQNFGEPDSISLHNSLASSEYKSGDDNAIIQRAIERISQRSVPFYQEIQDKFNRQQQFGQEINNQRLPSSPQSQQYEDNNGADIEGTFGVQKFSQLVPRVNINDSSNSNNSKSPLKMTPLFSIAESRTNSETLFNIGKVDYSEMGESTMIPSTMIPSPDTSKMIESSPQSFIKNVKERLKPSASQSTIIKEIETAPDIDHYLKHLMVPRRMKISVGGVPFQEVIFVLVLKFFERSNYFENFVFEWLDVGTTAMIGYIKCDFIKYVYKQGQKRFNIACKDPRNEYMEDETLHYVHVEASSASQCELYVNGLNEVIKYMEKSVKSPNNKGS